MGLQRYAVYTGDIEKDNDGEYYRAADVDALMNDLREAVLEERRLQRWHVARGGLDQGDCLDERGEWVRWSDVDALFASIWAAVAVERAAVDGPYWASTAAEDAEGVRSARAALDALRGE